MQYFAYGMGALLFALGLITYYLAPRVGPNLIFGVRVGYSYASREVWDKTNRFGGMLITLTGLGLVALALLLQMLNLARSDSLLILTSVMLIALLAETAWMFVYARRLAQGTVVQNLTPVKFRWAYLAPVLATFVLLFALAAYVYPLMPVERMASHFNLNDLPDGWMPRDGFFVTYLGLAALFVVLDAAVVAIATREPLIAFGRWGSSWRLDPERGLIYAGSAFGLVNLVLTAVLWDVAQFNIHGAHAFPLSILLWMIAPLIIILIVLFFALGRRER
jgi:uncharacterized membrane protein